MASQGCATCFAANLKRCRAAAGLSQEEVGFRAELHRTEIGLLERGARVPRIDTVIKLATALEAIELGAVKLGSGPKPRLRFDPQIAARVLRKAGEQTAADPPARSGKRADRPSAGGGSGVRLLPIRGRGENEPPPAA